jgi:hypothetical protein
MFASNPLPCCHVHSTGLPQGQQGSDVQARLRMQIFSEIFVHANIDNQYITISALWTLPTPVPWDATCERIATMLHQIFGKQNYVHQFKKRARAQVKV